MSGVRPIYWDTSALLSSLLADCHSVQARAWLAEDGVHLVSSLAVAEFHAVLARLVRAGFLAEVLADAAVESLDTGPWRRVRVGPDLPLLRPLATRWSLRGADLWHLALALTLKSRLPDLAMATFDNTLRTAAAGEGLLCTASAPGAPGGSPGAEEPSPP